MSCPLSRLHTRTLSSRLSSTLSKNSSELLLCHPHALRNAVLNSVSTEPLLALIVHLLNLQHHESVLLYVLHRLVCYHRLHRSTPHPRFAIYISRTKSLTSTKSSS